MKKALAILMIFALVASVAVAEISIGAWGRGIFVPVQSVDGDDNETSIQKTWEDPATDAGPRVGFNIVGNSDNVGFQVDIKADDAALALNDVAKIWVKPIDMITLTVGQYFDDTLRGNTAFGSFDWLRAYGNSVGEDVTFMRISSADYNKNYQVEQGFLVTAKPVDALFIAVNFADAFGPTENLFNKIQIQFGYDIDGIGLIRAQYYAREITVGGDAEADGTVEVAFKLTMIENLMVDFGFRMFTNDEVGALGADSEKDIAAYAKYSMDAITIHAQTQVKLFDKADTQFTVGTGVDYDMGDGIGIQGDVHYFNEAFNKRGYKTGSEEAAFSFFAGVKKGFSNGLVGVGVEVLSAGDTSWALPVRMEYWF